MHFAMAEVPGSSSEPVGTAQLMKIKIKTMEPATHELEVPASITIAALKREHIANLVDASADRQRIIYRGRALRDEQTLQAAGRFTFICSPARPSLQLTKPAPPPLGVEANDTLHLVIRPADMPAPSGGCFQNPLPLQGCMDVGDLDRICILHACATGVQAMRECLPLHAACRMPSREVWPLASACSPTCRSASPAGPGGLAQRC